MMVIPRSILLIKYIIIAISGLGTTVCAIVNAVRSYFQFFHLLQSCTYRTLPCSRPCCRGSVHNFFVLQVQERDQLSTSLVTRISLFPNPFTPVDVLVRLTIIGIVALDPIASFPGVPRLVPTASG